MELENLKAGISLVGIEPTLIATVIAVVPIGDGVVQVLYKTPEGTIKERLLGRADEPSISIATVERPWAFDGNGDDFKLAVEAKRIDLAFLFDPFDPMMAVHTSNVDALPHQITAVYESMLPRQPLRFVLADDPGAGKTIMAGLYIRELIMRADARRVLIVAPGSLVEQWRDELYEDDTADRSGRQGFKQPLWDGRAARGRDSVVTPFEGVFGETGETPCVLLVFRKRQDVQYTM
jgi:SNF2-related domain